MIFENQRDIIGVELKRSDFMKVIMRSIADVIPYENNPRVNDKAVEAVAASLKEFGFKQPIVVDSAGVIVVGHTRLKAAKLLGMDKVPVVVADDLTDEQIKAYRLADNKTAELAEWDFGKLQEEMDALKDVDMSVFGFIDESEFYGEDFTLDDSDKSEFVTMTLTLHEKQADAIKAAMDAVGEPRETFGNTNSHGNAIYEVVMEWAEQRT